MEDLNLIEKLKHKAHVSYEDAKDALENSEWDILDAIIYLERQGKTKEPSTSVFYTSENSGDYSDNYKLISIDKREEKYKSNNKNDFQGIFEAICKAIDTCNNIFLEISKEGKMFLKIPITVLIVLLIFTFGVVIPLFTFSLFFGIDFSVSGKTIHKDKINKGLKEISLGIKKLKNEIKRRGKHD